MPRRWRLLLDGRGSGPWNMGADEALLASAAAGPPALRLYAWEGPWLSLGYAQGPDPARLEACARAGVGVVWRATGGRAVLHGADLTYAVAAAEAVLPGGPRATYQLLAGALLAALRALGIEARRSTGHADGIARNSRRVSSAGAHRCTPSFDCFAEMAADELCVGDRKIVGSAQRRAGRGVLQHGSLRVAPDPPAARLATGLDGRGATSLRELGCQADLQALRQALVEAFAQALDARFEIDVLRAEEAAFAAQRGDSPHSITRFIRSG